MVQLTGTGFSESMNAQTNIRRALSFEAEGFYDSMLLIYERSVDGLIGASAVMIGFGVGSWGGVEICVFRGEIEPKVQISVLMRSLWELLR